MGKESVLKLGQRGPDACQEVPMRTPKPLYAHERIIYHPDLLTCPHCGDLLVTCHYLAWDKTVQMLARIVSVASRPGRLHLWLRRRRPHWLVATGGPRHIP